MSDSGAAILTRASYEARETISYWLAEWRALIASAVARINSPLNIPAVCVQRCSHPENAPGLPGQAALLLQPLPPAGALVALALPDGEVLRPALRLPCTSRRLARKALSFELARLCPMDPAHLYFDFRLRPSDDRNADVQVRVVRKDIVRDALFLCRQAGLVVAEFRFGNDAEPADWTVFPVDGRGWLKAQWLKWQIPALACLGLLLVLFAVAAAYGRGNSILLDLNRQIAAEQVSAHRSRIIRTQLRSTALLPAVLGVQKRAPSTIEILNELTRLLPDDTWLTALEIKEKQIRIQGYSRSASRLVPGLDGAHFFANARYEAPLTQEATNGPQRFDIAVELMR